MTLVVGIKYGGGIIMGSDSQATLNRGVPLKKLNQAKLFELKNIKNKIVIGGAGSVPFISKALEEIQEKVNQRRDLPFSEVISIAEKSVLHVARWYGYDRIKEMMPKIDEEKKDQIAIKEGSQDEEIKRDVIKDKFSQQKIEIVPVEVILIIAGIDENQESQIYIIYPDGIAEKQQSEAAIGSGAAYAEYILSQLTDKNLSEDETLKIIIQAISEVTNIDPGVGGEPQIMKITPFEIHLYDEKKIEKLTEDIEDMQFYVQNLWGDYLKGKFKPEFDDGESTEDVDSIKPKF